MKPLTKHEKSVIILCNISLENFCMTKYICSECHIDDLCFRRPINDYAKIIPEVILKKLSARCDKECYCDYCRYNIEELDVCKQISILWYIHRRKCRDK